MNCWDETGQRVNVHAYRCNMNYLYTDSREKDVLFRISIKVIEENETIAIENGKKKIRIGHNEGKENIDEEYIVKVWWIDNSTSGRKI